MLLEISSQINTPKIILSISNNVHAIICYDTDLTNILTKFIHLIQKLDYTFRDVKFLDNGFIAYQNYIRTQLSIINVLPTQPDNNHDTKIIHTQYNDMVKSVQEYTRMHSNYPNLHPTDKKGRVKLCNFIKANLGYNIQLIEIDDISKLL